MEIYKTLPNDGHILQMLSHETASTDQLEEDKIDINNLINQIKDQFTKIIENTDEKICELSYCFIIDALNDESIQDFLQYILDNDDFIQIFIFMVNLLKESQQNAFCIYAIQIINQLIFIIPINQEIFDDLYLIGTHYISLIIDDYSDEELPFLYECLNLIVKKNEIANLLFPKQSKDLFNLYCNKYLNENIKLIKSLIDFKNDNIEILQITLKSSLKICNDNNIAVQYFINNGFINLCFRLMDDLNPAFHYICELLEKLESELNEEQMIASLPADYPTFFKKFLIDQPDEIIKPAINLITHFSISAIFTSNILQLENFLEYLVFSDQSFKIRKSFLYLFQNIVYYHFQYVEPFISNFEDFNVFYDFIYNGNNKEVNCILKIISSILTKTRFSNILPDFYFKLIKSEDLIKEIINITINKNDIFSYENQILALQIKNDIDDLFINLIKSEDS